MSGNSVTNPIANAGDPALAGALAALDGASAVTFAADLFLDPADTGKAMPVFWNTGGFYLLVSDGAIRAGVMGSDGNFIRFFAKDATFADGQSHRLELSMDSDAQTFRVSIDGRAVFERANLDFVLPDSFAETRIGTAPGRPFGIEGRGRPLEFRLLHVIEFDDRGDIRRENVWVDLAAVIAQLPEAEDAAA